MLDNSLSLKLIFNEIILQENEQDQVIKTEEQRTDSQEQDAAKSQKKVKKYINNHNPNYM